MLLQLMRCTYLLPSVEYFGFEEPRIRVNAKVQGAGIVQGNATSFGVWGSGFGLKLSILRGTRYA